MKRLILLVGILSLSSVYVNSQIQGRDSLYIGRNCRLILYNGYEAEGTVDKKINDTVYFKTDIITLKVPVKDIKFVLNPGYGLPETQEEYDSLSTEIAAPVRTDTSEECDLFLDDRTIINDAELIYLNDSTLKVIEPGRRQEIEISKVRKIVFKPTAPFGKGFLIGAGIGFAAGFFSFAFVEPHGEQWGGPGVGLIFGLLLSVPTGLIGGVVGVITSSEDIYLFDRGLTVSKSKRLKYIIEKHRN